MPEVQYGRPWRGYMDAVSRQEVPPDKVTSENGDALNWILIPDRAVGRWKRRAGMTVHTVGLTEAGITYTNAGWPAGASYKFKGLQIAEHRDVALGLNFPVTWCAFIADEEKAAGAQGQLVWYDQAAAAVRRIAYNGAWAGGAPPANVVVWPWLGGNRMHTAAERVKNMAGARNFLDTTQRIYCGTYGSDGQHEGVPFSWNKKFPGSPIVAERTERVQPAGMLPPMWIPRVTLPAATTVGTESWYDKDMFYLSVLFIYEDGSWGPPVPVRPPVPELTAGAALINMISPVAAGGYGLVRLAATVGATAYKYIQLDDIPIGPGGLVVGRVIVQSPKVAGVAAAAAATAMPDPKDLRIRKIIMDNTTTSCVLEDGTDAGLEIDTKVRVDHAIAPPARYLGRMDDRIVSSYVRDNPLGIMVCFRHNTTTNDIGGAAFPVVGLHNTADNAFDATREAYVSIAGGNLNLYVVLGGGPNDTHLRQYALAGITLQQLVDKINSQRQVAADSNTAYRWHAQLIPGVNRDQLATNLDATGTAAFGDRSIVTTAAILLDGAVTPGGLGTIDPMRSVACSWPGVLKVSLAARPESYPGLSYFTSANPGDAKNAANHYLLGDPVLGSANVRPAPPNLGDCAGPWLPLSHGAIAPYTRGVARCWNTRDTDSGIDDDYKLITIDPERGVIAMGAAGHGFAVLLTTQGLYAYDETVSENGRGAVNLSADLYKPGDAKGILAYEIAQCIAAVGKNDSTGYFSIAIAENQIRISFRSSSAVTRPDVSMRLDFSQGVDQHGIAALINPDTGEPWGWGEPEKPADLINENTGGAAANATIAPSAMGVVRNVDGTLGWYGIRDKHDNANGGGSTDCRMETLDTGLTDNGSVISNNALYTTTLMNDSHHIGCRRVFTRYKKNGTGLTVALARSKNAHANPTYFNTAKSLPTSGAELFARLWWNLTRDKRTPTDAVEIRWQDDGTGPQPEVWDGKLEYEPMDIGV